jgi:hypothetical protein
MLRKDYDLKGSVERKEKLVAVRLKELCAKMN